MAKRIKESALRQWVRQNETNLSALSRTTGLSYGCIHKAARGELVSVESAMRISAATQGAVKVSQLSAPVTAQGWAI